MQPFFNDIFTEMAALIMMAAIIAIIGLIMRYVLTPLLKQLARSQELLVLFAIARAVTLAAVGVAAGFSKVVGHFSQASVWQLLLIGKALVPVWLVWEIFLLLFFYVSGGTTGSWSTG